MAKKRMVSNEIIEDKRFLTLSDKAKLLWFYANNHADDEGVVDLYIWHDVLHITSTDPLMELVESGLIIRLGSGIDLLSYVNEFETYNKIQPSRFSPSRHHDLKVKVLSEIELKKKLALSETEQEGKND